MLCRENFDISSSSFLSLMYREEYFNMDNLVAFLRGVNISGHNMINMKDLADLLTKSGFEGVKTYIQSGNIIFSSTGNLSDSDIATKIENEILTKFKLKIKVIIRSEKELSGLSSRNPFLKAENFDPSKMAVNFLHEAPPAEGIEKIKDVDYPPDKFKISGREIFVYCPNGFGRTKLYTNFFEKKMGVSGTSRNWRTIITLIEMTASQRTAKDKKQKSKD